MKAHGKQNEVYVVTNDRFGRDCVVEKAFDSLDKAIKFSKSDNLDNTESGLSYKKDESRVESGSLSIYLLENVRERGLRPCSLKKGIVQNKVPFKFATILAGCLSQPYPPSPPPPPPPSPPPAPLCPPPLPDDSGEGGFSDDGDCSVGFADSDGLGLLSDCDDGAALVVRRQI